MAALHLAIVSDLHCHHSGSGPAESLLLSDGDRRPATNHPVEALAKLATSLDLKVDALLMPGDIANKVDRQGLISGWDFVHQIARVLRAPVLVPTLGNHDVVSRKPTDDAFQQVRALSPQFPSADELIHNAFWAHGFCFFDSGEARFLSINSVRSHTNEESATHGTILPDQLAQLDAELAKLPQKRFKIAVCHHHPLLHEDIGLGTEDVMRNGGELLALLAKHGFQLVVHGHKHHPKLTSIATPGPMTVLAAGSFAAAMKGGLATRTRNVFHVVTLVSDTAEVMGTIKTWQFQLSKGWTPASVDAVDFPHLTGFGCPYPAATLADRVVQEMQATGQPFAKWGAICESVPELKFVPPSAAAAIGTLLIERNFKVIPEPPREPEYIGVPQ